MSNEVEKAFGDLDLHACQFHLSSILSFQPSSGDARKKDLDQEKRYNAVGCYICISKYDKHLPHFAALLSLLLRIQSILLKNK